MSNLSQVISGLTKNQNRVVDKLSSLLNKFSYSSQALSANDIASINFTSGSNLLTLTKNNYQTLTTTINIQAGTQGQYLTKHNPVGTGTLQIPNAQFDTVTIADRLKVDGVNIITEIQDKTIDSLSFNKDSHILTITQGDNSKSVQILVSGGSGPVGNYMLQSNPSGYGNFTFNDKLFVDNNNNINTNIISAQNMILSGQTELIDQTTQKLNTEFNPVAIASMGNISGQSDINKIKFIGDCNVSYGADGQIIIRIGANQNCSVYNNTDGISNTTVTYTPGTTAKTTTISNVLSTLLSAGYSRSNAIYLSSYNILFNANCGNIKTTLTESGNSVHFEDTINGIIRITYGDSVTASALHSIDFHLPSGQTSQTISGFTVNPTNWQEQPKTQTGATGCCVNINISWIPSATFGSKSTDFKLVKIQQLENESVVASWINSDSKIYGYLTDKTLPGVPTSASYKISTIDTKIIGGVTFLTNSSKMSPSAIGITNIAYPAIADNKINCVPEGGKWFTGFNTNNTIAGLTDSKDISMTWSTSNISMLIGQYTNPQIAVKGQNFIGYSSSAKNSAEINNAILVCDSNGYINNAHGSYTDASRKEGANETIYISRDLSNNVAGSADLQTYNGWIQYPNKDFSSFNKVTGNINPNYSICTGSRVAYLKVLKSGTIMNGKFTLTCSANPQTYFNNGSLKLEFIKANGSKWRDIMQSSVGTSYSWGTETTIGFTIDQSADYGKDYLYLRITMTGVTVGIGNITLA